MRDKVQLFLLFENIPSPLPTFLDEKVRTELLLRLEEVSTVQFSGGNLTLEYTGFISFKNYILIVFPKFFFNAFRRSYSSSDETFIKRNGRLLLDILRTYEKRIQNQPDIVEFVNTSSNEVPFLIDTIEFLIKDYFEYGIWKYLITDVRKDEDGEIVWERTISDTDSILVSSKPIYPFPYYSVNYNDLGGTISEIHKWAINYCFINFAYLLGYEIHIIEDAFERLEDIGDYLFLSITIMRQLDKTFSDREIVLLKSLHQILQHASSSNYTFSYGHNKFEFIWQDAISRVFVNELVKYKSLIPRIIWNNSTGLKFQKESIKLDALKWIIDDDNNSFLLIFDAKYYLLEFTPNDVLNNPGVPDIVKQYFYELVIKSEYFPWSSIQTKYLNYFVFPNDENTNLLTYTGEVVYPNSFLKTGIKLIYANPYELFNRYIFSRILNKEEINQLLLQS